MGKIGRFSSILFLSAALLFGRAAGAEFRSLECGESVSKQEANQLIDQVQQKYSKVAGLKAGFYQHSYLLALDTSELSSGTVWFSKPGRMKWVYTQPEEQVFVVNDETLWLYQPLDKQVLIHDFKDVLLTDLPVAFLMGIGDLRKDFDLKSACRNQEGIVLDLIPGARKKAKEELQGFRLLIDMSSNFPKGAEVIHVGGNSTAILLQDISLNPDTEAKLFEPKFPEGTDINDLRRR